MSLRRSFKAIVSIIVVFQFAGVLASQPQSSGSRTIYFTAVGKDKHPITDLKSEEVKIFENGKAEVTTSITSANSVPLTLITVVDLSGSTLGVPPWWRPEMMPFLTGLLRSGLDQGMVIHFNHTAYLTQAGTADVSRLMDALNKGMPGGGSAIYDALALAALEAGKTQGRKVILLISDGYDTASRLSKEIATRTIHDNDVIVYSITIEAMQPSRPSLSGSRGLTGKPFLEGLTKETSGRYLTSNNPKDLRTRLAEISAELRSQYAISFQASDGKADGAWRKLKIEVSRKNSKVQHRSGYYTKP